MLDGMTHMKASEVLKELKDYTEDLPHYSSDEVAEALEMAIKALEQRWIPVTERLPDDFEDVLCSTDASEVFMANYLGKMNDGTDCFDDDNGMIWEGGVIAWMPIPELYKEDAE